ncbi:hypothetical protein W909_18705 [Dickeya zeae EC1]|nr:hypothetical protein W909_18705 [Dickeya zeae EC1]
MQEILMSKKKRDSGEVISRDNAWTEDYFSKMPDINRSD